MTTIKFGTDGWRGRIAEDYTFDNLRRCAQGFATYLQQQGLADKGVVIGHDKRFHADHFAAAAAEVLAGNDIHVWLTEGATPTTGYFLCRSRQTSGRGHQYHGQPQSARGLWLQSTRSLRRRDSAGKFAED